jgi:hypothetical protein
MSRFLCVANALLLAASVAAQDSHPLTVTVAAAKQARKQTPVKVAAIIPESLRGALIVPLKTDSGQTIFGQLSPSGGLVAERPTAPGFRRPLSVLRPPELAEGESLTLTGSVTLDIQKPPAVFVWKDSAGQFAELAYGGRPVLRYMRGTR